MATSKASKTKKAPKAKRDIYKEVTDRILAELEAGVVPWHRPWATSAPMSMSTNKPYRGINQWLLSGDGTPGSNWWGTYDKITALGGQVRKGEKSQSCVLFTFFDKKDKKTGEKTGEKVGGMRYFFVFNATQADWPDGMPAKFTQEVAGNTDADIDAAEAIWNGYKGRPHFAHGGDVACYRPFEDSIWMPYPETFESKEAYWSTKFHEGTHSTGHAKRLNRDGVTNPVSFGSHTYGYEELIAEMGAAMLCGMAGIDRQMAASASYIDHWMGVIKADRLLLIRAASGAQKAVDHITGYEYQKESEKDSDK